MNLRALYGTLSVAEREELAVRAHINAGYLWQIANRWRGKRASVDVIKRLVHADGRLTAVELLDEFADDVSTDVAPDLRFSGAE